MTKIKSDKYGLYARFGGYLWRPDTPIGYTPFETEFKEGDEVKGYHGGGPIGTVTSKDKTIKERWFSHGSYLGKKSEDLYRPEYRTWVEPTGRKKLSIPIMKVISR